jgi:hypothetical protein
MERWAAAAGIKFAAALQEHQFLPEQGGRGLLATKALASGSPQRSQKFTTLTKVHNAHKSSQPSQKFTTLAACSCSSKKEASWLRSHQSGSLTRARLVLVRLSFCFFSSVSSLLFPLFCFLFCFLSSPLFCFFSSVSSVSDAPLCLVLKSAAFPALSKRAELNDQQLLGFYLAWLSAQLDSPFSEYIQSLPQHYTTTLFWSDQ